MHDIPVADTVMRNALEMHTRSLMSRLTATQEKQFYKFYPKGIDNMPIERLRIAHDLVRRTVLTNGDVDERID